jgi:hypothetical protein
MPDASDASRAVAVKKTGMRRTEKRERVERAEVR